MRLVREAEVIFHSWFNRYSVPAEELDEADLEHSTPCARYMTK
jgi:hypothetical protein